jgi:L-ornithine Nalpha-acyltransferase
MAGKSGFSRRVRDLHGLPKVLAEIGDLEVRLATTKREIRRAQKLRYEVFFEEGGAKADPTAALIRRDVCRFDAVCDHLIVVDNSLPRLDGSPSLVGGYRLLRQDVAEAHFGFYSETEFAVGALIARQPGKRFLELGRSCVAEGYRGKRTLELLWRGIWAYALRHRIDVMFGCASFPGTRAGAHADAFRFLRADQPSASAWLVNAAPGRIADESDGVGAAASARAVARSLPPLVKGYWRLGARFSQDAVVDEAFGTTDVLVVLPVEEIRERYLAHFAPAPEGPELAA